MRGDISTGLKLSSLLWRTRGFDWDYEFLLKPASRYSFGCYETHQRVFRGCAPREQTTYVCGLLCNESEVSSPFVGATFLDQSRSDEHGRPIAHYVIWFREGAAAKDFLGNTPVGWEKAFLNHVSVAFDSLEVFGSPETRSIGNGTQSAHAALKKKLRGVARTLVVTGPTLQASACRDVGEIRHSAELKVTDRDPGLERKAQTRSHKGRRIADLESLSSDIASAIQSGEAWALTHDKSWTQKRFPTFIIAGELLSRSHVGEEQQELTSRMLKSFTGSPEDGFIKTRLANSRRRFLISMTKVEPLRGFDAVAACLISVGIGEVVANLGEEQACAELARTVAHGAAAEDRFIRNLFLHIRQPPKT